MGFLDQSTNNIIVDAVLTDLGRIALARNDGSFAITKFALGDDEVDYGIITKFGRTVGKEKIIKNTPVLEANTNSSIALKHRLVSLSNAGFTKFPTITFNSSGGSLVTSSVVPVLTLEKTKSAELEIRQTILNENTVPSELRDRTFYVQLDNRFLNLGSLPVSFSTTNNVSQYTVAKTGTDPNKLGSILSLNVIANAITDSQFQTFGDVGAKTQITTFLKIIGVQSAAESLVTVTITKTS